MLKLILKKQNELFFKFLFVIIFLIFLVHFYNSFFSMIGNKWAFWELFVNYSGGFMKRGILGEIFIQLNETFGISPFSFFSPIFVLLYSLQIIILYKLIYPYKNIKLICILLVLSPGLILFNIYDINTYFTKDNFTKIIVLIHALFIVSKVNNQNSLKEYNKFLNFFIIPILFFNILNHEHQVFFVSVHLLLTLLVNYNYGVEKNFKCLRIYLFLILPFLLILITPNSFEKVGLINDSIRLFDVKINDQHAGNINLMIGGFLKWHFIEMPNYTHDIKDFLNLFICFSLSIFLFYIIFGYLLKKNVFKINSFIKHYYLLFFLPCLAMFICVLDHGRSINIISIHLISFFLALKINRNKLDKIFYTFSNNFLLKTFVSWFLFFYIFLWYIPVGGGYDSIGTFSEGDTIFKNTLMNEFINLFKIVYNFIDYNIITLPRIVV